MNTMTEQLEQLEQMESPEQMEFPEFEDLFNTPELWSKKLTRILSRYEKRAERGFSYQDLHNMLQECEAVGYTFDYGLDATPFNLRLK